MIYVATTPFDHKTGKSDMEFGKVTRKIYACENMQEALIVESNLQSDENTGYIKIYEEYPTFKRAYNIEDYSNRTAPSIYARLEDMDLTDIY